MTWIWDWNGQKNKLSPGLARNFLLPLGGDYSNPDTQRFEQATAGGGESGTALGPGSREERKEEAEQEKEQKKAMNP